MHSDEDLQSLIVLFFCVFQSRTELVSVSVSIDIGWWTTASFVTQSVYHCSSEELYES